MPMFRIITTALLILSLFAAEARQYKNASLAKVLTDIERQANGDVIINFSPSDLSAFTTSCNTDGLQPLDAIKKAIGLHPIKISVNNKYVTLQSYPNEAQGHIYDQDGSPVEYAAIKLQSVADPSKIVNALSDENGRWTARLPLVGKYKATASCLGYKPAYATVSQGSSPNIVMERAVTVLSGISAVDTASIDLQELVVNGDAIRNLKRVHTGATTVAASQLLRLPTMMGEPDVIKLLQQQPGIAQGIEGFTGLYVHGGENDQNLFLYEGLPLYHISHLGGVFSSFNAATISKFDFYKSAFPSAFGGQISSISDIKTNKPDFHNYHGRLSLGLISGNAYVTGPICKDKTAFAVGLRRTWLDVVSVPTLAILNASQKKKGDKTMFGYAFTDFNFRIDHNFSHNTSAKIVGYFGHDNFKIGSRDFQPANSDTEYYDQSENKLSWGNYGAIASISHIGKSYRMLGEVFSSNYVSSYGQDATWQFDMSKPDTYGYNKHHTDNAIHDLGAKFAADIRLLSIWNLQAGANFTFHRYLPEKIKSEMLDDKGMIYANNSSSPINAKEWAAFAENILSPADCLQLSLGLRYSGFHALGNTHHSIQPRASMRIQISPSYSIKAAYSKMTQYAQQIANNYITLPTDMWQPTAAYFAPLKSHQYSLGVYGNLPWQMFFSAEGWYKKMTNLMEYKEGISLLNPNLQWQQKLTAGEGWAYGADLSITKQARNLTVTLNYGLMWNWRKFAEINGGRKYPSKFDNRHKINITASYQLKKNIDLTASWVYTTGNRLTLALYNYEALAAKFPDAPGWASHPSTTILIESTLSGGLQYISEINNVKLPAYNRLDLGINFHKDLANGRSSMWSINLYNAYCRMNPITIKQDSQITQVNPSTWKAQPKFRTLSILPIVPSVTYTYIF